MKRRHITMKDLAKELKVSVATISRGLRHTHDVSEKTRGKIIAKAKELNFRPNFNAMGLVNNKSHNIAVILPTITNYYLPFGVAPNFLINGELYTIPMAIEESSVVAAASKASKKPVRKNKS